MRLDALLIDRRDDGEPVYVVGYRQKVRGPIVDEPSRYVVFVERSADALAAYLDAVKIFPCTKLLGGGDFDE